MNIESKKAISTGIGAPEPTKIEITSAMIEAGADFLALRYLDLLGISTPDLFLEIAEGLLRVSLRSREARPVAILKSP